MQRDSKAANVDEERIDLLFLNETENINKSLSREDRFISRMVNESGKVWIPIEK